MVARSQLKNAPYNPRTITDKARKKLQANIKRVGLIDPPVWNKRTGNLVGGHQRLNALDVLHGGKDYALPVSVVDLTEQEEKEQNVFLNNTEAQGEYDLDRLGKLFKDDKIDFTHAGFDVGDVYQLFGTSPLADQPEMLDQMAEKIRASEAQLQEIKERMVRNDDRGFYLVAVFESHDDRVAFLDQFQLPDNRYIDGRQLTELLADNQKVPRGTFSPNDGDTE